MTTETTNATPTETTEATEQPTATPITAEQEINGLRAVHQFFANYDRVPGFLANQWSQALDTIAVVANSLIAKNGGAAVETPAEEQEAAQQ